MKIWVRFPAFPIIRLCQREKEMRENTCEIAHDELKKWIHGVGEEEQSEIVKFLPSDTLWLELSRRNQVTFNKVHELEESLGIKIRGSQAFIPIDWNEVKSRFDTAEAKIEEIANKL